MQNNASIHNVDVVKLWFEEHNINFINWFSYSSDLNSIEYLWVHLKKLIYEVCLNIEEVCGSNEKV